jgi:hypothetical protein
MTSLQLQWSKKTKYAAEANLNKTKVTLAGYDVWDLGLST